MQIRGEWQLSEFSSYSFAKKIGSRIISEEQRWVRRIGGLKRKKKPGKNGMRG
jgi:hypothetical protein